MPKTALSVIVLLVSVFLVAIGGSLTGNAIAGGGQSVAGPSGADGNDGNDGGDGADGLAGAEGAAGPAGSTGPQGLAGVAGGQGEAGPRGSAGAAGPVGGTGAVGAVGPQGPAGAPGQDGAPGADGADGADASTGVRVAYRSMHTFDANMEQLLRVSPDLGAGVWLLELDWTQAQGTGGCDLTVGVTRAPVDSGFKTVLTLRDGEEVSVDCASASFSQPYELRSSVLRATRTG